MLTRKGVTRKFLIWIRKRENSVINVCLSRGENANEGVGDIFGNEIEVDKYFLFIYNTLNFIFK